MTAFVKKSSTVAVKGPVTIEAVLSAYSTGDIRVLIDARNDHPSQARHVRLSLTIISRATGILSIIEDDSWLPIHPRTAQRTASTKAYDASLELESIPVRYRDEYDPQVRSMDLEMSRLADKMRRMRILRIRDDKLKSMTKQVLSLKALRESQVRTMINNERLDGLYVSLEVVVWGAVH